MAKLTFTTVIILMFSLIMTCPPSFSQTEPDVPPSWLEGIETPEARPEPPPQAPTIAFMDVLDTHWAKGAVYDLVKMGITQGYPDGTFRGSKSITRYETALFLSRMSNYLTLLSAQGMEAQKKEFEEKYAPKLRDELDEIKKEIEVLKTPELPRPEFGYFEGRVMVGNFTSIDLATSTGEVPTGPRFDWRLKTSFKGQINPALYGEANIDTMDLGWGGGPNRVIATDLIDVLGRVRSPWNFDLFFTAGPGPRVHIEPASTPFPSEDGTIFVRPRNSFGGDGKLFEVNWLAKYSSLLTSNTGESYYHCYQLKLGYDFDEDTSFLGLSELSTTIFYDFRNIVPAADIMKNVFFLSLKPKWGFELTSAGGFSSAVGSDRNYYYSLAIKFEDLLKKGMVVDLSGTRVGSQYLNYPNYLAEETLLGVDFLDKLLYFPAGGADVGVKIVNEVSDSLRLKARGAVVFDEALSYGAESPGTRTSFEIGMDWLTYTYSTFGFIYRIHHEPSRPVLSTSDMFALSGKYEF